MKALATDSRAHRTWSARRPWHLFPESALARDLDTGTAHRNTASGVVGAIDPSGCGYGPIHWTAKRVS
jgi:hypothetical protein